MTRSGDVGDEVLLLTADINTVLVPRSGVGSWEEGMGEWETVEEEMVTGGRGVAEREVTWRGRVAGAREER